MRDERRGRDAARLGTVRTGATPGLGAAERARLVAEQRRRDRRRRMITGGVIAVTAAAVIITPQILNANRTETLRKNVASPPTVTQPTAATASPRDRGGPMGAIPCPRQRILLTGGPASSLDGEADAIRLCPANLPGSGEPPGWSPPVDALTTGAAAFLAAVAELPAARAGRCAAIRVTPDPYVFLIARPDGSVGRVHVSNTCDDVTLNGVPHESGAVLDAYLAALADQRESLQPDRTFGLAGGLACDAVNRLPPMLTRGPRVTGRTQFDAFVTCEGAADEAALERLNRGMGRRGRRPREGPAGAGRWLP